MSRTFGPPTTDFTVMGPGHQEKRDWNVRLWIVPLYVVVVGGITWSFLHFDFTNGDETIWPLLRLIVILVTFVVALIMLVSVFVFPFMGKWGSAFICLLGGAALVVLLHILMVAAQAPFG